MGIGGQSFGHVAAETTGCSSNENRFAVFFSQLDPFEFAPSCARPYGF
jgi:hypothetical protein